MKKGWEVDDYVNYVKVQMGGSIVNLACEQDLPFIVEKIAFEDLKNYMQTSHYMSCGYAPIIDLSDKQVGHIKHIFRNKNNNVSMIGLDSNMFIYQNQGQYGVNQFAKDQITYHLLINQVRNTLSTDLDWQYDEAEEKLYVYAQYPLPTSITIQYIPEFKDVSEIYTPYWISYLKRLSVAYAKECEGRIRSKYTLNSGTYNLDGNTLLQEAQSELQQIRTELNENINLNETIS